MTGPGARRAFSLIEVLVVIAVMGMLLGLLLSAVQSVRGAASRAACINNLRQLALAAQHHHDAVARFPAAHDQLEHEPGSFVTWPVRLLPYIEEEPLWRQTVAAYRVTYNTNLSPPHVGISTVVKVYICPADGRLAAPVTDDRGFTAAYGSYVGVGGGVARSRGGYDGAIAALRGIRMGEITDGASNTLLLGERPPWGRYLGGTWYSSLIDNSDLPGDPNWGGGAIESRHVFSDDDWQNCRGPFLYGPGRIGNRCDTQHFWSLHAGGANFALCDGSVRFIRYEANPLMPALATRAGGETVAIPD